METDYNWPLPIHVCLIVKVTLVRSKNLDQLLRGTQLKECRKDRDSF